MFKSAVPVRIISSLSQNLIKNISTKKMLKVPTFEQIKSTIPDLNGNRHKGQAGRIGIVGGSLEYTGAPYFAAISSLKVGADLVHIFCSKSAAPVIKSYSPELIVHPLLDAENSIGQIEPWLERLHVLVIGPGLGRDDKILKTVSELIKVCRKLNKPLIIDADGLFLISKEIDLIKNYNRVILTPNAMEFSLLFGVKSEINFDKIGTGVTILRKGFNDIIYETRNFEQIQCPTGGSGRRCGGQGDLLSGSLATFFYWAMESNIENPSIVASYAASFLIKECNRLAFVDRGRSMVCTDMIQYIHQVFNTHFEK